MLGYTAVAGTFDKKVVIMDTREEVKKMTYYRSHSMPVLGLHITDRHILSLSEDRTLVIYDRAAGKRYKFPTPEHIKLRAFEQHLRS